jgi:hypothetical protein
LNTVKSAASSSASRVWTAREVDAPLTRITGAPTPSRSKAMVVPSLERTLSMGSSLP